MSLRRSVYHSPDAYLQALRRATMEGDPEVAEQLKEEERRTFPIVAARLAWEENRDTTALALFIHLSDPHGDYPFEYLPEDIAAAEMLLLIEELDKWDDTYISFRFELAEALSAYCSDFHGGQYSQLYSILSQLSYHPAAGEGNIAVSDNESARLIYMSLVKHEQTPPVPQPLDDIPDNVVFITGVGPNETQLIQLGAYASQYFIVYSSRFGDALEWAAEWCQDNAPGYLTEPEYELDDSGNCIHCGEDPSDGPCEHVQGAEADLTSCDNLWIHSDEWYVTTIDFDQAKATELQKANLVPPFEGFNMQPYWGPYWHGPDDEEIVPNDVAEGQYYGDPTNSDAFEDIREFILNELDCEIDDLEIDWGWIVTIAVDAHHEPTYLAFGSFGEAVDTCIEHYTAEE